VGPDLHAPESLTNFAFTKQPQNLIFAPLILPGLQLIPLFFSQICNLKPQIRN
jgi:hypothetical protein